MKLKNIMIVVNDIEKSIEFYRELFGLQVIFNGETNVILTEGLVLQEKTIWEEGINEKVIPHSRCFELYFEERNLGRFKNRLKELYPDICYVGDMLKYINGKEVIRFYDLDGYIIEVATPV